MSVFGYSFELSNLRKQYGQEVYDAEADTALAIDQLQVPSGKVVSIVGFSGSGKTTLLNLLALLDHPTHDPIKSTELSVQSNPLGFSRKQWGFVNDRWDSLSEYRRENFGFVFQDNYLPRNLRVADLVRLVRRSKSLKTKSEDIFGFLSAAALDPEKVIKKYPGELSGGQIQRVMLAMALAKEADIIIADEPTSSLDYQRGQEVMQLFRDWVHNVHDDANCFSPKTVVLATHNLEQVCEFSDIVIVLRLGKVCAQLEGRDKRLFDEDGCEVGVGELANILSGKIMTSRLQGHVL